MSNSKFSGWSHHVHYTNVSLIRVTISNLTLFKCTFEDNKGIRLIYATYSNITVVHTTVRNNYIDRGTYEQMISFDIYCNAIIVNSTFIHKKGMLLYCTSKLGIPIATSLARDSNTLIISGCEFRNNTDYDDYDITRAIILVIYSNVAITAANLLTTE